MRFAKQGFDAGRIAASVIAAALITAAPAAAESPKALPTTAPAAIQAGLSVGGDVPTPLTLSPDDLAAMPRQSLHVKDHDGSDATYAGIALRDVLLKAGVPLGQHRLRGPWLGKAVLVTGADGYRVAFGLAEFDAEYAERNILLADRRNDEPLNAKTGPLRLVVPQEGMQGRWARLVVSVSVVDVAAK